MTPSPIENGWKTDPDGHLAVDWTLGDVLPQQLVEIVASAESNEESSAAEDDYVPYEPYEDEIEERDEVDNILDIVFDENQEE